MAKVEGKLNKKMAANEENKEQHPYKLKSQLKEKNDKMMAATEAGKESEASASTNYKRRTITLLPTVKKICK